MMHIVNLILIIILMNDVYSYRVDISRRSDTAFAALTAQNGVITWGDPEAGGNSSSVAEMLQSGVLSVSSSSRAFACVKENGAVYTWGDPKFGGDSSSVTNLLSSGVVHVYAASAAFAALKSNGSVVSWGDMIKGGDSSLVANELSSGVVTIHSTEDAFVAVKTDGSIVTWGHAGHGGYLPEAKRLLLASGVAMLTASYHAFAALSKTGRVVAWGHESFGGDTSEVDYQLVRNSASAIYANAYAFAAVMSNGRVVTWGRAEEGGSSAVVQYLLRDVRMVYSTLDAFAAVTGGRGVVTWGDHGGVGAYEPNPSAARLTSGVVTMASTIYAFAALKEGGEVVAWGDVNFGGDATAVQSQINTGVVEVFASITAFAALTNTGKVVVWGDGRFGGDSSSVTAQLVSGVTSVYSNSYAFAAITTSVGTGGSKVVTWGNAQYGGNSSSVDFGSGAGAAAVVDIVGTLRYDKTYTYTTPTPAPSTAQDKTSAAPTSHEITPAPTVRVPDTWSIQCLNFSANGCPTNYAEAIYSTCSFRICSNQYVTFTSSADQSMKDANIAVYTSTGELVYKGVRLSPGQAVAVLLMAEDEDGNGKCADYAVHVGCCCDIDDCVVELIVEGSDGGNLLGPVARLDQESYSGETVHAVCSSYIGWGHEYEYCYVQVCPGLRYTVYIGGGCDNELPVVETPMGTIHACDQELSFFGPASCQLLEIKQYCGLGAFVCTYSTHVDAVAVADAVDVQWASNLVEPMKVGAPLRALITVAAELHTDYKLYLFTEELYLHIQPCAFMDFYQHDVSAGQFIEVTRIKELDLQNSTFTYVSRYNVSRIGGAYILALVKSREYQWQVSVVAQSPVLRIPGEVLPVEFRIDTYDRDRPLVGSWQSAVPSQVNDMLAIYRINKRGMCNKNLVIWYMFVKPGQYSGEFDTDGFDETDLENQYYYSYDSERGFFFTDTCFNDEFEIRYLASTGKSREPLGIHRLDYEPTSPTSIQHDSESYSGYYLRIAIIIGSTVVVCAIMCSVIYSRGESVESLSALLYARVLERYTYDEVNATEVVGDRQSSDGDDVSCVDDEVVEVDNKGGGNGAQRKSRRIARGKNVVSRFDDDFLYL